MIAPTQTQICTINPPTLPYFPLCTSGGRSHLRGTPPKSVHLVRTQTEDKTGIKSSAAFYCEECCPVCSPDPKGDSK